MVDWRSVAVALALAVMACQERLGPSAFPTATATEQGHAAHRESLTKPASTIQIDERPRWYDSHLRRAVTAALMRVEALMAPLCSSFCGQVTLLADPNLSAIAQCRIDQLGLSSFISYKYDAEEWATLEFDSDWMLQILAHEYGHHLDFVTDTTFRTDHWRREIRAEVLAGCALGLAGADLIKALQLKRDPDDGSDGSDAMNASMRSSRDAIVQGAEACRATTSRSLSALVLVAERVAEQECLRKPERCR